MTHFPRLRQQDLGPLVARMAEAAQLAFIREWRRSGRPPEDLHAGALLASALLGSAARDSGAFPLPAWAEANRLAQDPSSLLNTAPATPASNFNG
ncbi:hypothetical protein [Variovorax paradoxus]|uniref:hypothetical protein n=1 Tax=Variovorax paradoxus TaxID=34073 RepID=UPI00285A8376|nr:hypothetical protein [Variovorax paradoxus]MDR6455523.1 hypothetical protein [Variovorax paradoxus]